MKFTKFAPLPKIFLVLSLICSFALTATAQNYYPSEIGNTWTLLSVDGAEQRTYELLEAEGLEAEGLFLLKISTQAIGTETVVIDDYFVSVVDGNLLLHQSRTDEGAFGIAHATFDPPATFFPAALPIGHQWEIVTNTELQIVGPTTSTSTIEVLAIEDVETPAGTFENCAKLQINQKVVTALTIIRYEFIQWLAPDVGPIKFQDVLQDITFELESYSLVEPPAEEEMAAEEMPDAEEVPAVEEVSTVEEAPATEEVPPAEETPTPEETPAEMPPIEETPSTEEAPAETPTAEMVPEEAMVSDPYAFDLTLDPGLNMISVPLMPAEPYTAKSLAEILGATAIIQLDAAKQDFLGYTIADEDNGFSIDGGKGYIVNTPTGGTVKFTGSAWDNQPEPEPEPVVEEMPAEEMPAEEMMPEEMPAEEMVEEMPAEEMPAEEMAEEMMEEMEEEEMAEEMAPEEPVVEEVAAAPALSTFKTAWAFIVTSDIQGMETGAAYTLVAENLRTGTIATQNITMDVKHSSAVWADLNRKSVIEAGDRLEIALYDDRGRVVSGPFQRTVTTTDIRNAFLSVDLTVGDVRPQETVLAQNFPNPFNPETWIPYQLSESTEVSIQIYDVSGRLVRTLNLGWQPVGSYMTPSSAAYWDGRNAVGERVASGIYFYTLQTSDFAATRRMVILK
ncbi:MAG: T9SS type A sorting domain-containing protein [Candidatus Poribacteria bacterium]|nr:T9SS type A sorting domain-containing protein [Candidatus Poribacteria bacterium]